MNSPLPKWIAIGAAFLALASFAAVGTLPLDPQMLDWLTTFSATLVSAVLAAVVGIWLFGLQTRINEDRERGRLQMMLASDHYIRCARIKCARMHTRHSVRTPTGVG
jgi:hypothetical protein